MDWCKKNLGNYRVQIGHAVVHVQGRDPGDAIRRARMELCHEYPRMFRTIQRMQDKQFRVDSLR